MMYLGDYKEDDTVYFMWSTNDADGASITRATDGTVSVYKDNNATQSVSGVTGTEDFDSLTGIHECTIDLSSATFYAIGADYSVVLSAATIDGQTVNAVLAHFSIENRYKGVTDALTSYGVATTTTYSATLAAILVDTGATIPALIGTPSATTIATDIANVQASVDGLNDFDYTTEMVSANTIQISGDSTAADNLEAQYDGTGLSGVNYPSTQSQVANLASGSAAISAVSKPSPNGFVITTGTNETNNEDSTWALDTTYHTIDDVGNVTDVYYIFSIGGDGVPVNVIWDGYAQAQNEIYRVYGYNWTLTAWQQIGTITGTAGATNQEKTLQLLSSHVGTSAPNIGEVRIRFESTAGDRLGTDRIIVNYAVVARSVGYSMGAIWVDTNASNTATEVFVDGVADNPVSTWAAALTLNTSLGLNRFSIANGSTITLSGNSDNYTLWGEEWTLDLNGQSCDDASFKGAHVSGTATGDEIVFRDCDLAGPGTLTIAGCEAHSCAIAGDIVLSAANTYYFDACYSGVAGTATPSIDFSAGVGNQNVNFRHYSGGIEIKNMGDTGTDNMSLEGFGQYVLNANCDGGTLAVRGAFKKTDNSGKVTISDTANLYSPVVHSGKAQSSTSNTITLQTTASAVDGAYDPSMIQIVAGTGIGQTRLIYQYSGSTKVAVVDRNWKVNPDSTSDYLIIAHPGREHVNEGLAQAGGASTITLNALASSDDNAYIGQTVFVRSGTGEDQVRMVTAYNGTSKVATVSEAWDTVPDATSGYVMLPTHVHEPSEVYDLIRAMVVESNGSITFQQAQSIMLAVLAGVTSNNGLTLKDPSGTSTRVTAVVNAANERTSMTLAAST